MVNTMRTSLARVDDLDEVVSLLTAQFDEHRMVCEAAVVRAAASGALDQPSRGTFLLARETGPVGLAYIAYIWTLEHGGRTAWLEELYVVPAMRSRGVGSALLRAVFAHAAKEECAAIDLEVDEDHARVASLYLRAGFRRLQRNRWYAKLAGR